MNKIALKLPGDNNIITGPDSLKGEFTNLTSVIGPLLTVAFYVAFFMAFIWLVWGAFAYIMAQGNKENLAKARARIAYAIIGLIIILLALFIVQFAGEIFTPTRGGLPF